MTLLGPSPKIDSGETIAVKGNCGLKNAQKHMEKNKQNMKSWVTPAYTDESQQ